MSFLAAFFDIDTSSTEVAVCCPFVHYTSSGAPYHESNASAHVNINNKLFHCKSCGTGLNEVQFIQQLLGGSLIDAIKLSKIYENDETEYEWSTSLSLSEQGKTFAKERLHFTEEVIDQLQLKTPAVNSASNEELAFPVFMYGHLLDIRTYNAKDKPKCKSRKHGMSGLVLPYDLWVDNPKATLLCAGEKDMAIARSKGFNAITLTGGEQALPKFKESFRGKDIAICYDNDEAGKCGARKLARALLPYANEVKVITGFHEVCKEQGEDLWDFFIKYGKERKDLVEYLINTPPYEVSEEELNAVYPLMSLYQAAQPQNINKLVRSNIQVVAMSESTFVVPSAILAEKFRQTKDDANETMVVGETREWELTEKNIADIMHLMDNNFSEEVIKKNIKGLLKINPKERCVKIIHASKMTVFKAYVTDLFETVSGDTTPMEYQAYAIGCKLESGKKYTATYKLVPHPYKGQQLLMCITNLSQANDSISNFKLDEEHKAYLGVFHTLRGTVSEKVHTLSEKIKGVLGYDGNNQLITTIDLAFHTALTFNFGTFKDVRGYLDTLVVGESRMGKSSTADALRQLYQLGTFVSLAGNSATIPGLVGGSNKTATGFQTRAGIIPQNHKGLIIFEEFGKSNNAIITELTDIRSSNEVRITRVSGSITLPAMVRMIALTNVKSTNGVIKSIATYPNGISVVTELVNTAEDIARYDIILILSDKGNTNYNPFWQPEEPLPEKAYQTRVRWIWSRTSEQIIIDQEVTQHIMKQCSVLNKAYDCHIKFFGTEAWKKITRLAIAVAGYLVSTDETYENIVVLQEHVDYAVEFYKELYDNSTFKLKEYVEHERKFVTYDDEAIALLQDIYIKHPSLILQLEQTASASKQMLLSSSGLGAEELNRALGRLTRGLFIRFSNYDIIPTERFRLCLARICKESTIQALGENNV